nr:hypothetical protein BaRGS_011353 [Batillaria attramentaria]
MAEQQQCKELRAEWEAEKMVLKDAVKEEKAHDAKSVVVQEAGNVLEASHDVIARSDDVSPLEPVVTQMAQQLTEVKAEVQTLKSADVQQDQAIQQAGTSVYVRWGNAACPASDQLVYSGVVGGSLYTNTGAATNTLCMSMTPVPSNYLPSGAPYTYVYGAEYRTHDSHHVKDAVCAVCRSPRPTTVMIPGTNKCVSGWTMEYSGFLMAGYPSQAAGSEYICVDSHFGSRAGGNSAQDGKLLYFTLAHCGALPCEPYVNGKNGHVRSLLQVRTLRISV